MEINKFVNKTNIYKFGNNLFLKFWYENFT